MKKLLLLAAFGVAGIMNAKTIAISHDDISFSDTSVSVFEESEWCGTVTFMTSCGLPIEDSYCTSWGEACLIESWNVLDEYYCAP